MTEEIFRSDIGRKKRRGQMTRKFDLYNKGNCCTSSLWTISQEAHLRGKKIAFGFIAFRGPSQSIPGFVHLELKRKI